MTDVQIASVDAPLNKPSLVDAAFGLVRRAMAVGLLRNRERIDRLDLDLLREIAREAASVGIGREAALALLENTSPSRLPELIERLDHALTESPLPEREMRELRRLFDFEQLSGLVGASAVSLRRYVAGSRNVPDDIAARAHWLALVAADLGGSYNDIGIRRWFERPRAQLNGRSPRAELGRDWSPDDDAAQRVRALAAALTGPLVQT